jgi:replicative DNA helicase
MQFLNQCNSGLTSYTLETLAYYYPARKIIMYSIQDSHEKNQPLDLSPPSQTLSNRYGNVAFVGTRLKLSQCLGQ